MEESQEKPKPKPAADANELAQIQRRTHTGLSSLSSVKQTYSGLKPLHSRTPSAPAESQSEMTEEDMDSMLRTSQKLQALRQTPELTQPKSGGFGDQIAQAFRKLLRK